MRNPLRALAKGRGPASPPRPCRRGAGPYAQAATGKGLYMYKC